jgi:hypothetical protein
MKVPHLGKASRPGPDVDQLDKLIAHWERMAAESEQIADTIQQNPLYAGNCYGMSDGLKMAADQLRQCLHVASSDPT